MIKSMDDIRRVNKSGSSEDAESLEKTKNPEQQNQEDFELLFANVMGVKQEEVNKTMTERGITYPMMMKKIIENLNRGGDEAMYTMEPNLINNKQIIDRAMADPDKSGEEICADLLESGLIANLIVGSGNFKKTDKLFGQAIRNELRKPENKSSLNLIIHYINRRRKETREDLNKEELKMSGLVGKRENIIKNIPTISKETQKHGSAELLNKFRTRRDQYQEVNASEIERLNGDIESIKNAINDDKRLDSKFNSMNNTLSEAA